MPSSLARALSALEVSRDCCKEIHAKLGEVIATKRVLGRNYDDERRLRSRASYRQSSCDRLIAELRAAGVEVEAPTRAEIDEVHGYIAAVRDMVIEDAIRAAGFRLLTEALESAATLAAVIGPKPEESRPSRSM